MKHPVIDHGEHVRTWLTTIVLDRILGLSRHAEGGCWLWQGACNGKNGRKHPRAIPVMALPNRGRKGISVRRLSALIAGRTLGPNSVVLTKCRVQLCVNPEHMRSMTRRQMVLAAVKDGRIKTGPSTSARKLDAARRKPHVKLTMEKARAMRARYAEIQNAAAVAKEFGVSPQHAHRIIIGKWWRDPSPFDGMAKP